MTRGLAGYCAIATRSTGEAFRQRVAGYHGSRTHLALAKDAPTPRRVQGVTEGDVIGFPGSRRLAPPLRTTRRLT
jgi:hypothetical protein